MSNEELQVPSPLNNFPGTIIQLHLIREGKIQIECS